LEAARAYRTGFAACGEEYGLLQFSPSKRQAYSAVRSDRRESHGYAQQYRREALRAKVIQAGEDNRAPGQEFVLPKNFAIESDGLRFRYEEDQIDPHSIAVPEFIVPCPEIKELLRPDANIP